MLSAAHVSLSPVRQCTYCTGCARFLFARSVLQGERVQRAAPVWTHGCREKGWSVRYQCCSMFLRARELTHIGAALVV